MHHATHMLAQVVVADLVSQLPGNGHFLFTSAAIFERFLVLSNLHTKHTDV